MAMTAKEEFEFERLKERLALLESVVLEGKPYVPGMEEYERACEAAFHGDKKPLFDFVRRGGKMPG